MSKSKLEDLNDLLMMTLQNIVDPEVDENDEVINEITTQKATSVARVAQVMVNNAKVQVDAYKLISKGLIKPEALSETLLGRKRNKQIGSGEE